MPLELANSVANAGDMARGGAYDRRAQELDARAEMLDAETPQMWSNADLEAKWSEVSGISSFLGALLETGGYMLEGTVQMAPQTLVQLGAAMASGGAGAALAGATGRNVGVRAGQFLTMLALNGADVASQIAKERRARGDESLGSLAETALVGVPFSLMDYMGGMASGVRKLAGAGGKVARSSIVATGRGWAADALGVLKAGAKGGALEAVTEGYAQGSVIRLWNEAVHGSFNLISQGEADHDPIAAWVNMTEEGLAAFGSGFLGETVGTAKTLREQRKELANAQQLVARRLGLVDANGNAVKPSELLRGKREYTSVLSDVFKDLVESGAMRSLDSADTIALSKLLVADAVQQDLAAELRTAQATLASARRLGEADAIKAASDAVSSLTRASNNNAKQKAHFLGMLRGDARRLYDRTRQTYGHQLGMADVVTSYNGGPEVLSAESGVDMSQDDIRLNEIEASTAPTTRVVKGETEDGGIVMRTFGEQDKAGSQHRIVIREVRDTKTGKTLFEVRNAYDGRLPPDRSNRFSLDDFGGDRTAALNAAVQFGYNLAGWQQALDRANEGQDRFAREYMEKFHPGRELSLVSTPQELLRDIEHKYGGRGNFSVEDLAALVGMANGNGESGYTVRTRDGRSVSFAMRGKNGTVGAMLATLDHESLHADMDALVRANLNNKALLTELGVDPADEFWADPEHVFQRVRAAVLQMDRDENGNPLAPEAVRALVSTEAGRRSMDREEDLLAYATEEVVGQDLSGAPVSRWTHPLRAAKIRALQANNPELYRILGESLGAKIGAADLSGVPVDVLNDYIYSISWREGPRTEAPAEPPSPLADATPDQVADNLNPTPDGKPSAHAEDGGFSSRASIEEAVRMADERVDKLNADPNADPQALAAARQNLAYLRAQLDAWDEAHPAEGGKDEGRGTKDEGTKPAPEGTKPAPEGAKPAVHDVSDGGATVRMTDAQFENWNESRKTLVPVGDLRARQFTLVDAKAAPFETTDEAVAWAEKHIVGTMKPEQTGGKGEIRISRTSVDKMVSGSATSKSASPEVHRAALASIHEIIRESAVAEVHLDRLKGPDGKRSPANGVNPDVAISVLYGAMTGPDGRAYRVKTTLKRVVDSVKTSKAYSYEVSEIEVLKGNAEPGEARPSNRTSIAGEILLQGVRDVNGNLLIGKEPASPTSREIPKGASASRFVEGDKGRVSLKSPDRAEAFEARIAFVDLGKIVYDRSPGFRKGLQNRGEEAGRDATEKMIGSAPDADTLTNAGTMLDEGTPVLSADLQTVAGNTRMRGLVRAAELGRLDSYLDRVRREAERLGVDLSGMETPIMVRILSDEYTEEQQEHIAEVSNRQSKNRVSAENLALDDAKKILSGKPVAGGASMLDLFAPGADGQLDAASNRDFMFAFVRQSGDNMLLGKDELGRPVPNAEAYARAQRALVAAVLHGEGSDRAATGRLLGFLFGDAGMKRIASGLAAAAPSLVRAFDRNPSFSLRDDLRAALSEIEAAKERGESLEAHFAQGEMFPEEGARTGAAAPAIVRSIASAIDERARSGRRVRELLQGYAERIYKPRRGIQPEWLLPAEGEENLFGERSKNTKEGVWNRTVAAEAQDDEGLGLSTGRARNGSSPAADDETVRLASHEMRQVREDAARKFGNRPASDFKPTERIATVFVEGRAAFGKIGTPEPVAEIVYRYLGNGKVAALARLAPQLPQGPAFGSALTPEQREELRRKREETRRIMRSRDRNNGWNWPRVFEPVGGISTARARNSVSVEAAARLGVTNAEAERLEREGYFPDEIFRRTRWYRGVKDDEWRYELPPLKLKSAEQIAKARGPFMESNLDAPVGMYEFRLDELVDPDTEFLKAYPQAGAIKVRLRRDRNGGGSWSKENNRITGLVEGGRTLRDYIDDRTKNSYGGNSGLFGLLHHELQHFVQDTEGWPEGGDWSAFRTRTVTRGANAGMKAAEKAFAEAKRELSHWQNYDDARRTLKIHNTQGVYDLATRLREEATYDDEQADRMERGENDFLGSKPTPDGIKRYRALADEFRRMADAFEGAARDYARATPKANHLRNAQTRFSDAKRRILRELKDNRVVGLIDDAEDEFEKLTAEKNRSGDFNTMLIGNDPVEWARRKLAEIRRTNPDYDDEFFRAYIEDMSRAADDYAEAFARQEDGLPATGSGTVLTAKEQYWRLAGEVEARNAERRAFLSDEEAAERPPSSTMDRASGVQTIRRNGRTMRNAAPGESQTPEARAAEIDARDGTELSAVVAIAKKLRDGIRFESRNQFFRVAKSTEELKRSGLTGEFFTISDGVIRKHDAKGANHAVTPEEWVDVAEGIVDPVLIERYRPEDLGDKSFRIWTNATISGRDAIVGVIVKSAARNMEVNSISTVFGAERPAIKEENIVYDKRTRPERERALLIGQNSRTYRVVSGHSPSAPLGASAGENLPQSAPEVKGNLPAGVQKQVGVNYPDAGEEIKALDLGGALDGSTARARNRAEVVALLQRKRPDLDAEETTRQVYALKTPKERKLALHWVVRGAIRLPEDAYKIDDALEVAGKAKVDPFSYKSPMDLIEANREFDRGSSKPIDPATVPELSDPRDEGDGIVSYEVQDTREGQAAMRRIMNSHWGKDENGNYYSPWCLLHDDGRGGLSNKAWGYWQKYSALPKRAAFKNGILISFMATDGGVPGTYAEIDNNTENGQSLVDEFWSFIKERYPDATKDEYGIPVDQWDFFNAYESNLEDIYQEFRATITDKPASNEEWWDRKDESHPDLDWARGGASTASESYAADGGTARARNATAAEAARLDAGPTVRVYRAMQIRDGKLYPPMAGKVDGKWQNPAEIGRWIVADERPDLVDADGRFKLDKGNGSSIKAAYNPYWHTSRSPLNDQFSSAWRRPELVTVEVEVPASELTSGYKAEKAKDAVGEMAWHNGPVSSRLAKVGRERRVILSRYCKVVRIVPDAEVADRAAEMLRGTGIAVPANTVTPSLRRELLARGVDVAPTKEVPDVSEPATARARGGGLPAYELNAQNGLPGERMDSRAIIGFRQADILARMRGLVPGYDYQPVTASNEEFVRRGVEIVENDPDAVERIEQMLLEGPTRPLSAEEQYVAYVLTMDAEAQQRNAMRLVDNLSNAPAGSVAPGQLVAARALMEAAKQRAVQFAQASQSVGTKLGQAFQFRKVAYRWNGLLTFEGLMRDFQQTLEDKAGGWWGGLMQGGAVASAQDVAAIKEMFAKIQAVQQAIEHATNAADAKYGLYDLLRQMKKVEKALLGERKHPFGQRAKAAREKVDMDAIMAKASEIADEVFRLFPPASDRDPLAIANATNIVKKIGDAIIQNGIDRGAALPGAESFARELYERCDRILRPFIRLSVREYSDIYSNYGQVREASRDELFARRTKLSQALRLVSQIDDLRKGQAPRRTGQQRIEGTDEQAALEKKLHALLKELDPEAARALERHDEPDEHFVKTPLQIWRDAELRELRMLEAALATGIPIERNALPLRLGEEELELRALVEKRRAEYRAAFETPATDEERIQAYLKILDARKQKLEKELEAAKRGEFKGPRQKDAAVENDARVKLIRAELEEIRAKIQEEADRQNDPVRSTWAKQVRAAIAAATRRQELAERWLANPAAYFEDAEKRRRRRTQIDEDAAVKEARRAAKEKMDEWTRLREKLAFGKMNKVGKALALGGGFRDIIKLGLASGDISGIGVQCALACLDDPKAAGKAIRAGVGAFLSEKDAEKTFLEKIKNDPFLFEAMEDYGLKISSFGPDVRPDASEEGFARGYVARRAQELVQKNLGKAGKVLSWYVDASERAFTLPVDILRLNLCRVMAEQAERNLGKLTAEEKRFIGRMANAATGRGDFFGSNSFSAVLSKVMWAPARFSGQLQMMALPFTLLAHSDVRGGVKLAIAKHLMVRTAVGYAVAALLAWMLRGLVGDDGDDEEPLIEIDPRSSKFGRLNIGGRMFSITGGLESYVTLAARIFTGETKTKHGDVQTLEQQRTGRTDLIWRLLKNKATPDIGLAMQLLDGKAPSGEKIERRWLGENGRLSFIFGNSVFPLTAQDVAKVWLDERTNNPEALLLTALTIIGYNSTDFGYDDYEAQAHRFDRAHKALKEAATPEERERVFASELGRYAQLDAQGEALRKEYRSLKKRISEERDVDKRAALLALQDANAIKFRALWDEGLREEAASFTPDMEALLRKAAQQIEDAGPEDTGPAPLNYW